MAKKFNTTGACIPAKHYMVDLTSRLETIKKMIDEVIILRLIARDNMERLPFCVR
ncbi:MAG: hypothetical protein LUI87_04325 [Lachnospiraceae bacterium]|nr:hypothetical protein [Lachnospiraceae bacterium]